MGYRKWTPEQDAQLIDMVEEQCKGWGSIAEALQRRPGSCGARYSLLRPKRDRGPIKSVAEITAAHGTERERAALAKASARNDARYSRDFDALSRGDITPVFFGDPPPGFSELDKRRARAS